MSNAAKLKQDRCLLLGHTEQEYAVRYWKGGVELLWRYQRFLNSVIDDQINKGARTFFALSQSGAPLWMATHVINRRAQEPDRELKLFVYKSNLFPPPPYAGQDDLEEQADDVAVVDAEDEFMLRDVPLRLAGRAVIVEACPDSCLDQIQAEHHGATPFVFSLPAIMLALSPRAKLR